MTVVFLNRTRKQGAKGVVGPITGIKYLIGPEGTPVSALDADGLLAMTEPPCCGETLPFGGQVRSFGGHVPTPDQLKLVPDHLWDAQPLKSLAAETKSGSKKKLYEEYEREPVQEEEPADVEQEEEPVDFWQEDPANSNDQESESEEE